MRAALMLSFPILLALAGCGQSSPPPAPPAAEPPAAKTEAPAASGQELNNAIQQPLDKARAVEDQLMQDKAAADAEIDDQSGG